MIEIQGITKRFSPQRAALDGVSLNIQAGQIFGVLGPNGAGKTTLLRILCTLLKADSGSLRVAGFDALRDAASVRRCLGVLNADMGLYSRLSGRENLQFFAGLYGLKQCAPRIESLCQLLQIGTWIDQRVGGYSTGMRQKVNIARALIHMPRVLILDEASNGLDVMARRALIDAARAHAQAGHLVLYSTHVMSEAQTLCERVAILMEGRLVAHDATAALIQRHGQQDLEHAFIDIATKLPSPSASAMRATEASPA
jgi:sodium transport system ATP-binding protein